MIEFKDLIKVIEEIAPPSYAESWDSCGIQVGSRCFFEESRPIYRVLVALDVSEKSIAEAKAKKCDFILAHHPMFSDPLGFKPGLAEAGISVYSAHTSFDSCPGGNNDYLAEMLKLTDVHTPKGMIGKVGRLERPLDFDDFLDMLTAVLCVSSKDIRYTYPVKTVETVGLCTGSGSEFAEAAGCDVFITGDLKYHSALEFYDKKICVIDAGHYGTEWIFVPNMCKKLKEKADVEVLECESSINPFFMK